MGCASVFLAEKGMTESAQKSSCGRKKGKRLNELLRASEGEREPCLQLFTPSKVAAVDESIKSNLPAAQSKAATKKTEYIIFVEKQRLPQPQRKEISTKKQLNFDFVGVGKCCFKRRTTLNNFESTALKFMLV